MIDLNMMYYELFFEKDVKFASLDLNTIIPVHYNYFKIGKIIKLEY